jgi:hypothetical protein
VGLVGSVPQWWQAKQSKARLGPGWCTYDKLRTRRAQGRPRPRPRLAETGEESRDGESRPGDQAVGSGGGGSGESRVGREREREERGRARRGRRACSALYSRTRRATRELRVATGRPVPTRRYARPHGPRRGDWLRRCARTWASGRTDAVTGGCRCYIASPERRRRRRRGQLSRPVYLSSQHR